MAKLGTWRLGCVGRLLLLVLGALVAVPGALSQGMQNGVGPKTTEGDAGLPSFEVASVRENKSDEASYSNFPLNPGPQYDSKGGLLIARNMLLLQYIVFAYKPTMYQLQAFRTKLPDWARSSRFDIQARATGSPTKDDMRLMMQSLLAERFHMQVHHEKREVPVYVLTLAKPGKMGASLKPHPVDDPECLKMKLPKPIAGGYPVECGASASIGARTDGNVAAGGYNVDIDNVAGSLAGVGSLDRPVVDETGLTGKFDFTIEFTPKPDDLGTAGPDFEGTTFVQAVREQLGLKLVPQKGPIDVIIIDRLERPTEN
jgi:uncharacterized protein (TIGR03435 family)